MQSYHAVFALGSRTAVSTNPYLYYEHKFTGITRFQILSVVAKRSRSAQWRVSLKELNIKSENK